ncbi:McrC: 5-methylcytosine-specific restriction protein [Desulfosarcina variabilis str. Montpellier]|uniref:5-methylcytosine-specific restriction endonuclease system specificity protein McrC n=1 Tax=Desulfosarcina variabilis TaxID=2300 RepID=UPI003AFB6A1D
MIKDSKIPIQNIYYLLCYAWNRLDERDVIDVSGIDSTSLVDLFAKVLCGGVQHLLRRGLDRGYVDCSEDVRCLKGKLLFSPTIKRNLLNKATAHCEFDELNHNILHNRILKTTLLSMIRVESLDSQLKDRLIGLYRRFNEVDPIKLSYAVFSRVQLHRNNAFYDFLLKICELVFDNLLASESPGKSKFRDFFQDDEKRMAALFEDFVRNFYRLETIGFKVGREDILWQAEAMDEASQVYLPKMVTDISIEGHGFKVVIDTKFYREALASHYDAEKIRSQHFYQIFAYLKNLERQGGVNTNCTGVLLYPTVQKELCLNYTVESHKVMIYTINLNQDWQSIDNDLKALLDLAKPNALSG